MKNRLIIQHAGIAKDQSVMQCFDTVSLVINIWRLNMRRLTDQLIVNQCCFNIVAIKL